MSAVALRLGGNPFKTLKKIYDLAQDAQDLAREKFGDEAFHNGKGDAFKHAYFSCAATQELGGDAAKQIADAHETQGGQPSEEKEMDEKNNKAGRNLGRPGVDCEQAVTAAVEGDALVTIE